MPSEASFKTAVAYLEGLSNMRSGMLQSGSRTNPSLYLKRTDALLKELKIDLADIKFVHIAGTSGKGSVSNLIYQGILTQGKKCGLLTSPFVTSTIEKIAVNGKYIAPKSFAVLTEKLKKAIDTIYNDTEFGCPSYFECITIIALMYFVEQKCEYAVIETGCGGRYDSTNIIPSPLVTTITNVDLDHVELLGDTVEKIAYEKAGIIKKGSTFYTIEHRPNLLELFENICIEKGVAFNTIEAGDKTAEQKNLELANAVLKTLSFPPLTDPEILNVKLPARYEIFSTQPHVVIDGAHNPAKMKSTADNWQKEDILGKRKLILSLSANKDVKETIKSLVPLADVIYITHFLSSFRKPIEPKDLYKLVKEIAKPNAEIKIMLDPVSAFKEACADSIHDSILVTGSFFLAADIRSLFFPESYILKKRVSK